MLTVAAGLDNRHRRISINVAGTRAVPQLTDAIGRVTVFLVLTRLIIAGVTCGTVGGVGCEPIGHRLAVACMAIIARQVAGVRPGIGR